MIRINTNGPQGHPYQQWLVQAAQARQNWLQRGPLGIGAPQLTADENRLWDQLREFFLEDVFHRKCAFCEVSGSLMPLQVVPYRPLAGVTEGQVPVPGHPGYYWLAFEWFNLLLSCSACAEKANEFPVGGQRMHAPEGPPGQWLQALALENPHLVSPYEPWPVTGHFGFHVNEDDKERFGFIFGITPEARATISACRLNRDTLVAERRKAARERSMARVIMGILRNRGSFAFGPERPFSAWLNFVAAAQVRRRA
jgi:hypothetical protein